MWEWIWTYKSRRLVKFELLNFYYRAKDEKEIVEYITAITTVTWVIAALAVSTVFSLWSLSTPQGLWISVNQLQLILLLLLTGAYFPQKVIDYLESLKFALMSFTFIKFEDLLIFRDVIGYLTFSLKTPDLKHFDINSGCTFHNSFSFTCIIVIIMMFHLVLLSVNYWIIKCSKTNNSKLKKCTIKLVKIIALGVYLRMFLESFLFITLSPAEEIRNVDLSSESKALSYSIAWVYMIISISFLILVYWQWRVFKSMIYLILTIL